MSATPRQLKPATHRQQKHGADDDLAAASKAAEDTPVDYKQYMPRLKPEHRALKRLAKIVVTLVVIAGCGAGAYYYGTHIASKQPAPKATTNKTATTTIQTTKQYTSTNQNLSFVYPSTWHVNETADIITATSKPTELKAYNKQAVTGEIIFRIRDSNVALTEFAAGSATAIINSQLMNYVSPASGQRASTYVSFLNYASSKGSGIDGIYITGNTGYQAGQSAPESDIQAVNPVISFTFVKCVSSDCKDSTAPLTLASGDWSDQAFSKLLLSVLKSLSI